MKRSLTLFILFLGMSFLFSSCGAKNAAEKKTNQFFALVIKGDYANASKYVESGLDQEEQLKVIARMGKNDLDGKLVSAKKSWGFKTQVTNGITRVTLPYQLKYERKELSVQVRLVDNGSGFKIQSIN